MRQHLRCVQSSGDFIARYRVMLEFYACVESCVSIEGALRGQRRAISPNEITGTPNAPLGCCVDDHMYL